MKKKQLKEFWNDEYKDPTFFSLSTEPSADLQKFTRWMQKEFGKDVFRPGLTVLDLGCGNGRNLAYLCEGFGMNGIGYDISEEAIRQAQIAADHLKTRVKFHVRSVNDQFPLENETVEVVLDMMTSHFLKEEERKIYLQELLRVMQPGAFLFFKSFYAPGDMHAKRLVKDHAAGEKNAYIHPRLKVYEYVWTDQALEETFGPYFTLLHKEASHKHFNRGKPNKRRSVVCYFQKK